ncbi:S8 family serine peptidase [Bdellovibrio sp. HCB2-146]|uniref:S8 family serine peptidase n=1 Tax=Bdellovibrio sp. HCB2-146 TaxID=3394362 RepID=UPI0039BCA439
MKKTFFALAIFALLGCNEKGAGTGHADGAPVTPQRMNCQIQGDAFSCVRMACENAGAHFNEDDLSCTCPNKQLFTAQAGGSCLKGELQENNTVIFKDPSKGVHFYLTDKTKGNRLADSEIAEVLRGFSAPIFPGMSNMMVFRDGQDFLRIQKALDSTFIETLSFGMPNTYLAGVNVNGGVYNAVIDRNQMFQILPSHRRIDLSTPELSQILEQALGLIKNSIVVESIYSFSNLGCAEICVLKSVLINDSEYRVTRTRIYSGGNPINDQINIYNKTNFFTEVSVVLFSNQPSHYILRENGEYNLYANDGTPLAQLANHSELERGLKQSRTPVGKPVIIFEDGYNAQADSVAVRGPYSTSYYGWFGPQDHKPFLYGKTMSEWGEDYTSSPSHAYEVSRLASLNFQRAIIPFSSAALMNGDFATRLSLLPKEHLVASVSVAFPYEKSECLKSPVAQTIAASKEQILWTIGAGNSGRELQTGTLISCPQILRSSNTLIIASTSGSDRLSYSSTYGQQTVDIAESGCTFESAICSDSQAATSYAAPRAARLIANIMKVHPSFKPEQVRTAVLLTARVPYRKGWASLSNEFLPVRSGGILDTRAALDLLQYLEDKGVASLNSLSNAELLNALVQVKSSQYDDIDAEDIEDLVKDQITRFKKTYKDVL